MTDYEIAKTDILGLANLLTSAAAHVKGGGGSPEFLRVVAGIETAFDAAILNAVSSVDTPTKIPAPEPTAEPMPAAEPVAEIAPEPVVEIVETPEVIELLADAPEEAEFDLDADDGIDDVSEGVPADDDAFTVFPAKECSDAEYEEAKALITRLHEGGFAEEIKMCLRVGGKDRLSTTPRHAVPSVLAALKHVIGEIQDAGMAV